MDSKIFPPEMDPASRENITPSSDGVNLSNDRLKPKLKGIPKSPGVYQFLNKDAEVIYVGKAKNLKSRVTQYFGKHDNRPQLPFLMAEATNITYTVVTNELESAFLENTIIKQYSPKYNIDLKDDKNYAFIKIDSSTEIPQIATARKIDSSQSLIVNRQLSKFFGPYSAAYKIRSTLNLVRKIFPYCAAQKVGSRPCFYYYMHRCPGVCIGKISLEEYQQTINKIVKFLQGDISFITKQIQAEMKTAAKQKKFETAARLRDQLRSLIILQEKQNVILPKKVDWDIVSLASSDGFTCINLFKIRGGKMFDKENFVYELPDPDLRIESGSTDNYGIEIQQRFLEQYYLETSSIPKIIHVEIPAIDQDLIKKIVQSRFNKKIQLAIPQKGQLKKLINLGKVNAEEYLKNWLAAKAGNLDKINAGLNQLKEILKLESTPKIIECYDISNTQGTNPVGSMVVFVDGLPAKSQYRKFKIQGKKTPDDFAMMREMLSRRLARSSQQSADQKSAWPLPDLIVIDGGKGQLGVAVETINNSRLTINTIGLAKRIEEIFLPHNPTPIILNHNQPGLQLLQRLRDEAHRFGITFHRQLRSKQAVKSALDDIPGIGPKTKKLLKTKFGTVAGVRKATLDELANVVGKKLADKIKTIL